MKQKFECKKCLHFDNRDFQHCPECGEINKERVIRQALSTPNGRENLAKAMVEPFRRRLMVENG